MQISISQAATLIGTSEEMLKRWARQGAIPATETGGVLCFEEKDLENWAARRHMPLRRPQVEVKSEADAAPSLLDAMTRGGFHYGVAGTDSESLLTRLIQSLEIPGVDPRLLLDRVIERETLSSTGIGNGIAIPHPRQPLETLSASSVVTCFPSQPVSFAAVDNQPVTVVFLMLSIDTRAHLKLLSQLSYLLHQPAFAAFFRGGPSSSEILQRVAAASRAISE